MVKLRESHRRLRRDELRPGVARPPRRAQRRTKRGVGAGSATIEVLVLDVDGVVTDGRVSLGAHGGDEKAIAYRDLDALTRARASGLRVGVLSGEAGALAERIAHELGAEQVLLGCKDKSNGIRTLAARFGVGLDAMAYVGDAERDVPALEVVGLGLAPRDASRAARRAARSVLDADGGRFAVEAAVELIQSMALRARDRSAHARRLAEIAQASLDAHRAFLERAPECLAEIAGVLSRAIASGNKILFCGNGGSAADAEHAAGELIGRFLRESAPWPAIALTTSGPVLTAIGNDWSFDQVFARQVRGLGRPGDVLVAITTSGTSPNILAALAVARELGLVGVAFTGERGAALRERADHCFVAPASDTPRVQELHGLAFHALCEVVEASLMP